MEIPRKPPIQVCVRESVCVCFKDTIMPIRES